jgi:hypothetical protein
VGADEFVVTFKRMFVDESTATFDVIIAHLLEVLSPDTKARTKLLLTEI